MKKMRKFEDGGSVADETGTSFGTIKRNTETGELYDTEGSFKPVSKSTPTAEAKPKAEAKAKAEPKKSAKEEMKEVIKPPKLPKLPGSFEGSGGGKDRTKAKVEPGMFSLGRIAKNLRERAGITSYKSGGSVSSASSRADGCAIKGKTKGRMM
jgi:hypothetical protein